MTTSTSVRLNNCYIADIRQMANEIKALKLTNSQDIENEIKRHTKEETKTLLFVYDMNYCKVIIKTHAKNNIFEAIKRIQEPIDLSDEIKFYKQLAFSYVEDIIYNKIKTEYKYMMIPAILISEPMECSICLCGIDDTRVMTMTRCNHYFHRNCLTRWKASRRCPTCPNCRVAI